jgi:hypothetical protein
VPSPESIADAFLPLVIEECRHHGATLGTADLME